MVCHKQPHSLLVSISTTCMSAYRIDVLNAINTTTTPSLATPLPTTHTDISLSLIYVPASNPVSSRVTPWLALAIVRAICCCVSWALIVWISDFDRLLGKLMDCKKNARPLHVIQKVYMHTCQPASNTHIPCIEKTLIIIIIVINAEYLRSIEEEK